MTKVSLGQSCVSRKTAASEGLVGRLLSLCSSALCLLLSAALTAGCGALPDGSAPGVVSGTAAPRSDAPRDTTSSKTLAGEVRELRWQLRQALTAGDRPLAENLYDWIQVLNRELQRRNNVVYGIRTCTLEEGCEIELSLELGDAAARYRRQRTDSCTSQQTCQDTEDNECIDLWEEPWPVANSTAFGELSARPFCTGSGFEVNSQCILYVSAWDNDAQVYVPENTPTSAVQAEFVSTFWGAKFAAEAGINTSSTCTADGVSDDTPEQLLARSGSGTEMVICQCPTYSNGNHNCGSNTFSAYVGAFKQGDYRFELHCGNHYGRVDLWIYDTHCVEDDSEFAYVEYRRDPDHDAFYDTNPDTSDPETRGSGCPGLGILWGHSQGGSTPEGDPLTAVGGDCTDDVNSNPAMVFHRATCEESLTASAGAVADTPPSGDALTYDSSYVVSEQSWDDAGAAIVSADLDGDGGMDPNIGAPDQTVGDLDYAGAVYLSRGPLHRFGGGRFLASLAEGGADPDAESWVENAPEDSPVLKLTGATAYAHAGNALAAGAMPANGDRGTPAFRFVAIGQKHHDADNEGQDVPERAGSVFLVFSPTDGRWLPGGTRALEVCPLRAAGVRVAELRGSAVADRFGFSLAAGDLDGDGAPELAVGAPYHSSGVGRVYVFDSEKIIDLYLSSSLACTTGSYADAYANAAVTLENVTLADNTSSGPLGHDLAIAPAFTTDASGRVVPSLAVLAEEAPGNDGHNGAVLVWKGFAGTADVAAMDADSPAWWFQGAHGDALEKARLAVLPNIGCGSLTSCPSPALDELVLAAPNEQVTSNGTQTLEEAGAVWVLYGRSSGTAVVALPADDSPDFQDHLSEFALYRLTSSEPGRFNRFGSAVSAGAACPTGSCADVWLLIGEEAYGYISALSASGTPPYGRAALVSFRAPSEGGKGLGSGAGWPSDQAGDGLDIAGFAMDDAYGLGHHVALAGDLDRDGRFQEVTLGALGSLSTYLTTPDPGDETGPDVVYMFWGDAPEY